MQKQLSSIKDTILKHNNITIFNESPHALTARMISELKPDATITIIDPTGQIESKNNKNMISILNQLIDDFWDEAECADEDERIAFLATTDKTELNDTVDTIIEKHDDLAEFITNPFVTRFIKRLRTGKNIKKLLSPPDSLPSNICFKQLYTNPEQNSLILYNNFTTPFKFNNFNTILEIVTKTPKTASPQVIMVESDKTQVKFYDILTKAISVSGWEKVTIKKTKKREDYALII